jgi:hypothetical protein
VAAVTIARPKRGKPPRVRRGMHQTRVGDVSDGIDLRLRRSGPLPGANPAGHSLRPQPNRETSRGVSLAGPHLEGLPPHLVSGRSRAGVPNRLLAGFDALAGRARLLAERLVDGRELSRPEGRASQACGQRRERIPALRCRSGPVWSSERRYEVIKLHIRLFLREKETLTYRRSGCYPNLSSLSTPFFHRGRTGLHRPLKTSVRASIRMLLPIPRPCQSLFSAGRTGVNRVLKDTGPGTVG